MKIKRETRLRRSMKGFTLTELVVSIPTALIVLLASGMVLVTGHASWDSSWEKTNLQRDASYAMFRISQHIKEGTSAEMEDDGKAIKIYKDTDEMRFFLEQDSNDLKCEIEGRQPETILSGIVEDLQFNVDNNKVGINLMLKKDNLETHLISEAMIRNYGN